MKQDIHPEYNDTITAVCDCGAKHEVGSTKSEISVELCSACHPFYTGKQKLVDTAGRVEKFQARVTKKDEVSKTRKGKRVKAAARATSKETKEKVSAKKPAAKKKVEAKKVEASEEKVAKEEG